MGHEDPWPYFGSAAFPSDAYQPLDGDDGETFFLQPRPRICKLLQLADLRVQGGVEEDSQEVGLQEISALFSE